MKKNILLMIVAIILSTGLASCSDSDKYPFKDISENIVNYVQSVIDDPGKHNDENLFRSYIEKQKKLCKKLHGKTLTMESFECPGWELVSEKAEIGEGSGESSVYIPVNIKLKVTDADLAYKNDRLMVLLYDDNHAIFGASLEDEKTIKQEENQNNQIMEFDEILSIDSLETEPSGSVSPYSAGEVVTKGFTIEIEAPCARLFSNATKAIIMPYDNYTIMEVQKGIKEERNRVKDMMKGL